MIATSSRLWIRAANPNLAKGIDKADDEDEKRKSKYSTSQASCLLKFAHLVLVDLHVGIDAGRVFKPVSQPRDSDIVLLEINDCYDEKDKVKDEKDHLRPHKIALSKTANVNAIVMASIFAKKYHSEAVKNEC